MEKANLMGLGLPDLCGFVKRTVRLSTDHSRDGKTRVRPAFEPTVLLASQIHPIDAHQNKVWPYFLVRMDAKGSGG